MLPAITTLLLFVIVLLITIIVSKHITSKSNRRYKLEHDLFLLRQELNRLHQDLGDLWDVHYKKRK